MKIKIILIVDQPITKWLIERFGINYYEKNKINYECWNLTSFKNKKLYSIYQDYIKSENIIYFDSYKNILNRINNLEDNIYYINYNIKKYFIFDLIIQRILRFKKYKKLYVTNTLYPYKKYKFNILDIIKFQFYIKLLYKIINKIYDSISVGSDYFFICNQDKINSLSNYFSINCLVYNDYLKYLNKKKNLKTENYYVFIDQMYVDHPDWIISKKNFKIDPDEYYKKINLFFDKIKAKFNANIVIALHPRRYAKIKELINYKQISNKTLDLISNCNGVLTHDSTSIQYAVLFKKPIYFIVNKNILNSKRLVNIKYISSLLDRIIINIENENNINKLKEHKAINKKLYLNFENTYIKSTRALNINSWEYIVSVLKKINN